MRPAMPENLNILSRDYGSSSLLSFAFIVELSFGGKNFEIFQFPQKLICLTRHEV